MSLRIINTRDPLNDPAVLAVRDRLRSGGLTGGGEGGLDIPAIVRQIIADVTTRGDAAVVDLERRLDRAELTPGTLRVSPEAIAQAHRQADREFLALMRRAAENIRRYQQSIKVQAPPPLQVGGRSLAVRYTPIDRVGVYVPGGRAMYPSTVLMTVVPAQTAGVKQIAMASPPTRNGEINPMVLALAAELGVSEVYRLGGAVAVAAMAIGTAGVAAVDKIVGPGNAFVAEAKRQLFGRVGIDSIAGPSEVLILADATAPAEWVAADLLAQAEHDPGSAVLVTTSSDLASKVVQAVERQLASLERSEAARAGLERHGAIIVVSDLDAACATADLFASEHLQIMTADDAAVAAKIRHAGAIFLGPYTPVPLGDYYAGPSHVLPTGQTARFFSPLSVNDFLKSSSVVRYDATAVREDAADVADFARREGLTAHARAAELRRHDRPR